jgi:hypothetical protein
VAAKNAISIFIRESHPDEPGKKRVIGMIFSGISLYNREYPGIPGFGKW